MIFYNMKFPDSTLSQLKISLWEDCSENVADEFIIRIRKKWYLFFSLYNFCLVSSWIIISFSFRYLPIFRQCFPGAWGTSFEYWRRANKSIATFFSFDQCLIRTPIFSGISLFSSTTLNAFLHAPLLCLSLEISKHVIVSNSPSQLNLYQPTLHFLGIVRGYTPEGLICTIIANTKKYVKFDWLTGVQYGPYLYSVFNICTLLLNKRKNKNITFDFRGGKIEMYSLKTN